MLKNYIGCKLIKAEPMNKYEFYMNVKGVDCKEENEDGYMVAYPDGYKSWSPKDVFEKAYMGVNPNRNLKTDISISQEMVDNFIKEVNVSTIGEKTTFVRVVLVNGFELVEASACVDKENYSEEIGGEICLNKIKDKIWSYLGFLLQTAVGGVKK
jgi:hypothetical protein